VKSAERMLCTSDDSNSQPLGRFDERKNGLHGLPPSEAKAVGTTFQFFLAPSDIHRIRGRMLQRGTVPFARSVGFFTYSSRATLAAFHCLESYEKRRRPEGKERFAFRGRVAGKIMMTCWRWSGLKFSLLSAVGKGPGARI